MNRTTLWRVTTDATARNTSDDESEWRCSSCHKWQHGMAKNERKLIQRFDTQTGQLGAVADLCMYCAWLLVSQWLVPDSPYPSPAAFPIAFDVATLYQVEDEQGEQREELTLGRMGAE